MDYTDLHAAGKGAKDSLRQQPGGTHADEIETSMMLYLRPDIVQMPKARPDFSRPGPGYLTRNPNNTNGIYSPTGAWGDPTLATLEKGKIVVDALLDELCAHLIAFADASFPTRAAANGVSFLNLTTGS